MLEDVSLRKVAVLFLMTFVGILAIYVAFSGRFDWMYLIPALLVALVMSILGADTGACV